MARPKREVLILAKSMYRQMTSHGFGKVDIIQFTTEMLDLLASNATKEAISQD